jgi:hypothetical protein
VNRRSPKGLVVEVLGDRMTPASQTCTEMHPCSPTTSHNCVSN